MTLTSMKLKKKSKVELKKLMDVPSTYGGQDEWPYGLQLCFEKEQIEKLSNLKKLKVGDSVKVSAEGNVMSVRISERQVGSDDHSIRIQLKDIDVERIKK